MTQREPDTGSPCLRPPVATLPTTAGPTGQQARRPVLSWVAAFGALVVAVLLVRTVLAYPLLPVRLAGPAAPTSTPFAYPGPGGQSGPPQVSSQRIQLAALSMSSPVSGWAIGYINDPSGTAPDPLLLRFSNGTWYRVPIPSYSSTSTMPSGASLSSILAVSDDEAWATAGNVVLHYSGGTWLTDFTLADPNIYLSNIAMVSSDEGWAIGAQANTGGQLPVLYHRLRGTWSPVPVPQSGQMTILRSISMFSPSDGWISGLRYTSNGSTSIALHYTKGRWTEVDAGLPATGGTASIAAVGPDEAWVVGYTGPTGPGYIAHYIQSVWQGVPSPTPNMLHAISMLAPDMGLIGGDGAATLRLRPDGTWVKEGLVIHGVALTSIDMVSATEGWAAGGNVLLHLYNGTWSVYKLNINV